MSKLIVEMEMPTRCIRCKVRLKCKRYVCGLQQDIAEDLNPLIGDKDCLIKGVLPEEHGDLIDRDELRKMKVFSQEFNRYVVPMMYIEEVKPIIAAERKDDEQIH